MRLKKFFNSDLHRRIIIFFHENRTSIDTPRGIAAWTGYSREEAKSALSELKRAGILNSISTPSTSGYSYTQDPKIINQIEKLTKKIDVS